MKKTTLQQIKILKTLNRKGFITTNEALFKYSPPIKRLAAVMYKIKRKLKKAGGKQFIETHILPDTTAKYILSKTRKSKKKQSHYTRYDKMF